MRGSGRVAAAIVVLFTATPDAAYAAHPNALWRVVHDVCVPLRRLTHLTTPCLAVDLAGHTAVVPNPRSATEVLLVPTRRVSGVEDPALQTPGAPDYWTAAWGARGFVARRAGVGQLPSEDMGMAVNAIAGRSQDQLHIHIDCVRPEVKAALASVASVLTERWTHVKVQGGVWRARRLVGDVPAPDPFRLLAQEVPGASAEMGAWTVVVAGLEAKNGAPGFALLARRTAPGFGGHGEFLLDKRCAVLKGA